MLASWYLKSRMKTRLQYLAETHITYMGMKGKYVIILAKSVYKSAMRQRIWSFLTEKSCICLSKADLYNMYCCVLIGFFIWYIITKTQYCSLCNINISFESHFWWIVGGRTIWTSWIWCERPRYCGCSTIRFFMPGLWFRFQYGRNHPEVKIFIITPFN